MLTSLLICALVLGVGLALVAVWLFPAAFGLRWEEDAPVELWLTVRQVPAFGGAGNTLIHQPATNPLGIYEQLALAGPDGSAYFIRLGVPAEGGGHEVG